MISGATLDLRHESSIVIACAHKMRQINTNHQMFDLCCKLSVPRWNLSPHVEVPLSEVQLGEPTDLAVWTMIRWRSLIPWEIVR